MRGRRLAAGGAACAAAYLLALGATMPATLVDSALRDASAGRLRVVEARGTLWSGDGYIEIRDAAGRAGMAKPVAWRLLPRELLRARLGYAVELDRTGRAFPVALSRSRIELADADLSLPASALGLGVPELAALDLTGDMRLRISSLSFARGAALGNATAQWRGAGSALSPVSPLGDYELRIAGEGAKVSATLHTLQGPLQLDGQGSWANGRRPVFSATARVPPPFQERLSPFLRLIAVQRGEGIFELELK